MVITETLTVVLVLVARRAGRQDWHPVTAFFTTAATFFFLFLYFGPAQHLIPEWAGVTLQCVGVVWTIFAKLSLGRSFGLLPADRGIVTHGAYRWVRHPVYLGYFLNNVGYLLPNFGLQNLVVYGVFLSFQLFRVLREEKLLSGNPEYRAYCEKVRWRLVPFVF
jgi:protein-S-isoprenylcysteine O-methyltransferase Ste14